MLNTNKNSDFDSDNLSIDEDVLSALDLQEDDKGDDSADEEEEVEIEKEEDSENDELLDNEDGEEDDEETEESDLEPILADAIAPEEKSEEGSDKEDSGDEYGEENEKDNSDADSVAVSKAKIILAKRLVENMRENSARLADLFGGLLDDGDEERIAIAEVSDGLIEPDEDDSEGKVVEGIFNGENMIGPDGKEYGVPANYASKSKLVEGDILKLTITERGIFRYKQTKPIERKRVIGKLEKDSDGNYFVSAERKKFRVITASITYYKGIPGDQVVILLPVAGDSLWAAVENVIKSK